MKNNLLKIIILTLTIFGFNKQSFAYEPDFTLQRTERTELCNVVFLFKKNEHNKKGYLNIGYHDNDIKLKDLSLQPYEFSKEIHSNWGLDKYYFRFLFRKNHKKSPEKIIYHDFKKNRNPEIMLESKGVPTWCTDKEIIPIQKVIIENSSNSAERKTKIDIWWDTLTPGEKKSLQTIYYK